METTIQQTVQVTLVMSQDEARWLKGTMQNPLHGQDLAQEHEEDRVMREKFFHSIPNSI